MFSIAYNKITKKILLARNDKCSSAAESLTPQQQLEIHCEANNLEPADYIALELPAAENLKITFNGKQIYNESTGKVEEDPNWVAPPRVPPPLLPENTQPTQPE
jgi:hypothetical protein